ncbi:unnamed protein product [Calicophoron daubneyi]|uniref:Uncharacterized protein n=1 Tax=Calicophoron daubneyi TaxID=300641 RepID=A0AAV2TND4_CALDB
MTACGSVSTRKSSYTGIAHMENETGTPVMEYRVFSEYSVYANDDGVKMVRLGISYRVWISANVHKFWARYAVACRSVLNLLRSEEGNVHENVTCFYIDDRSRAIDTILKFDFQINNPANFSEFKADLKKCALDESAYSQPAVLFEAEVRSSHELHHEIFNESFTL